MNSYIILYPLLYRTTSIFSKTEIENWVNMGHRRGCSFCMSLRLYHDVTLSAQASFSKFVSIFMLMRHFTVLVTCCHQICFLKSFCPNYLYFTLFSSFTLIFVTSLLIQCMKYNVSPSYSNVYKDPYFLVYF